MPDTHTSSDCVKAQRGDNARKMPSTGYIGDWDALVVRQVLVLHRVAFFLVINNLTHTTNCKKSLSNEFVM